MSDDEAVSREEARLLRTMAHASKPSARPRSWSMKKETQEFKDLNEQIHKAEVPHQQNRSISPPVGQHEASHLKVTPAPHNHHPPASHLTVSAHDGEHNKANEHSVAPQHTIASEHRGEEVAELPYVDEEERIRQQERQAKMEQERFSKFLGRTSVTKKEGSSPASPRKEVSLPHFPVSAPLSTGPKIVPDKSPRVFLEITGAGSTKAEAGKLATFIIKTKSINIAAEKTNVDVTVKITAANAEGHVGEVANNVHVEGDGYHVTYTPTYIGPHTVDIFVLGQLGHTMTVPVIEGGPYAPATDATYYSLKNSTVGNKAMLVVSPMSYIKRLVPLGYSSLAAKVDHVESKAAIKNVSVLGNKEGHYVVSFYPALPGDHIISVTLNGEHISGSPFVFNVIG